jgi:hypothetical protein
MQSSKPLIWIGLFIGSTLGGFVPSLWGASMLSASSILLGGAGGVIGVLLGYKYSSF